MLRKISKLLLSIIAFIIIFSDVSACAADYGDQMDKRLIDDMFADKNSYAEQISEVMSKSAPEITQYDVKNAYRVNILEPLFLTYVMDTSDFISAATDIIQWKIPVTTAKGENGLVTLTEESGTLSYVGISIGEATKTWYISKDSIITALTESAKSETPLTSIQIMHSYLYNTAFVYLSDEESEYLIPFSYYAKECEIENGKMYTLSEIIEKFNYCFDERQIIDNPSYNGGAPFRQRLPLRYKAVYILLSLVIGIVLLIFIYHKKPRYISKS